MLSNKVAIVTGASRGIGAKVAKTFAENNAVVIVNYAGSKEKAENVVDEIIKSGGKAEAYKCNVASFDEVKEMMEYVVKTYGRIDILVNNAGITKDGLFVRMDMEQWERVIKINLTSAYCVTHAVIKHMMKARQGSIINMSSIVGRHGNAGQANYSASKAGLIGLTQTLAKEFGGRNIRVNAVCPGFIQTAMTQDLANIDEYLKAIPMKRLGTPEDIAKVVKFLALDTDYVTGQAIEVAGGLMI